MPPVTKLDHTKENIIVKKSVPLASLYCAVMYIAVQHMLCCMQYYTCTRLLLTNSIALTQNATKIYHEQYMGITAERYMGINVTMTCNVHFNCNGNGERQERIYEKSQSQP